MSPEVVVLRSALLQVMDRDELTFVLGHELGHVRLGHTRLNSLVGGMAGIPSPFVASALLSVVFLWWNRACEYSADRAGLLACGRVSKAISALVKLEGGVGADLGRTLQQIEAEDDHAVGNLLEALSTHPMMVRRIEALQSYGASDQYRRLRQLMDRNVGSSS
jgi:Zn-dependent protease with chaperone function